MFANGAPAQVQTLGTVALGNMIAAREVATLPDGKVLDESRSTGSRMDRSCVTGSSSTKPGDELRNRCEDGWIE